MTTDPDGRIRGLVGELMASAPPPPGFPVPTDRRSGRPPDRRSGRPKVVVASVAVLVIVGVIAGLVASSRNTPRSRILVGPATAPTTTLVAPTTPQGWVRVNYGDASIAVPPSWQNVPNDASQCLLGNDVLLFVAAETDDSMTYYVHCPKQTSFARLQSLSAVTPAQLASGTPLEIGGHSAVALSSTAGQGARYYFADLGVVLTVVGPQSGKVLASIGWSQTYLVLHPTGQLIVPADWKTVTQDGITLKVPPDWPTVSPPCVKPPSPGHVPTDQARQEFTTPQVIVGFPDYPCMAAGVPFTVEANVDGVYIRTYTNPIPSGSNSPVTTTVPPVVIPGLPIKVFLLSDGQRFPDFIGGTPYPVLYLEAINAAGAEVAIDIGLGPDPTIAQDIIASLAMASSTP